MRVVTMELTDDEREILEISEITSEYRLINVKIPDCIISLHIIDLLMKINRFHLSHLEYVVNHNLKGNEFLIIIGQKL